jgi:HNH endonuclease
VGRTEDQVRLNSAQSRGDIAQMLTAITSRKEISLCQEALRKRLSDSLTGRSRIHVGYQGGGGEKVVWHDDLLWYAYRRDGAAPIPRHWNAFGLALGQREQSIVVEINPALSGYRRQVSGLFARNTRGEVVLLHTGKIGGGRKGVGKSAFEASYEGEWTEVATEGREVSRAIEIGRIHEKMFMEKLLTFVQEVNRFKMSVTGVKDDEEARYEREQSHEHQLKSSTKMRATEKRQLILARRGHGLFCANLLRIEKKCRVTGVSSRQHLRASHIKPWVDSSSSEKLDGNNGLLLAPHIDHLFDRGYLTFFDDGTVRIAKGAYNAALKRWRIPPHVNVGSFNKKQCRYLAYHRRYVFKSEAI